MQRQVKYRAKALSDGRWVYGDRVVLDRTYIVIEQQHMISWFERFVPVDPATVGEWTGRVDGVGKEEYEDDLVQITDSNGRVTIGPIVFEGQRGRFAWRDPDGVLYGLISGDKANLIIGNLHDSPELLEDKPQAKKSMPNPVKGLKLSIYPIIKEQRR